LIGALSTHRIFLKPDLPISYKIVDNKVQSEEDFETIKANSIIESADNTHLYSIFQLEFLLDSKKINDKVLLTNTQGGIQNQTLVTLVPFYRSLYFIIISLVVGITFIISAVFVISKKPLDFHAGILFWILLLFGLASFTSPGKFNAGTDTVGIIVRISHAVSYILGIAVFLYFSYVFPVIENRSKILTAFIFVPSLILALFISAVMTVSMIGFEDFFIRLYEYSWTLLQSLLTVSILYGVFNFYSSARKMSSKADKHKVQWILWGITAGVFPYIILFVIPTVTGQHVVIPEEYSMLPLILVPISFAFAVLKYHIFDIEVIIKRSIVYSVLTGFIVLLYFSIIAVLSSLFHELSGNVNTLTSLIAAFVISFTLYPARISIQKFVDRTFYRERYNFEQAVTSFTRAISESSTLEQIGKRILKEITTLIPVEKIGLLLTDGEASRIKTLAHYNMDKAVKSIHPLRFDNIKSDFKKPFAIREMVQQEIDIDQSLSGLFRRWDLCLAIPLKIQSDIIIGGIVLGKKLSGIKYTQHDIELLSVAATEAAIALNRLQLQENIIAKEIENQKLEELNSLKSFFVSSVTHDLKTPLTSIKMFAEMLKNCKDPSKYTNYEYLSIIEGESNRLEQLIDNMLTYSKIESEVQKYDFGLYCLNNLVREAQDIMKYQFKINKFEVITCLSKEKLLIPADKNAALSVLVNLLSNAIKYSHKTRKIIISTGRDGKFAYVFVEDHGIGIQENDLCNIFEPYFRSDNQGSSKTNGTGLGLAIVKHTMESHKGKIEASSIPGNGSTFKLFFPLSEQEINIRTI
jgi:signal transduction histidine kinase